jgi:hypothetical protein
MLVINSIDKARLSADSFSYSGNGVAWKAKLVLFLGFALMAGGLAGSAVRWSQAICHSSDILILTDCNGFEIRRTGLYVSIIMDGCG